MHSNKSATKCENEYELKEKFPSLSHKRYKLRQLAPIEDFTGIYVTEATCIVENYVLLNNEASKSLESIEIFIREVADVRSLMPIA